MKKQSKFKLKKGKIIGPLDMFIAAHAKPLNITLVSNNSKEFERVESVNPSGRVTPVSRDYKQYKKVGVRPIIQVAY